MKNKTMNKTNSAYTDSELDYICEHINKKELNASRAQRDSIKFKQVEFLIDKIGKRFMGVVTGVKDWGVYVEIMENKCEGMLGKDHLLSNGFLIDSENHKLEDGTDIIKLGDEIEIEVSSVSLAKKEIDFSLVYEDIDSTPTVTKLYSGFPGTGKSYFFNNGNSTFNGSVIDSDSSKFDKSNFPKNYIKYINKNIGIVDGIFISSHKDVRDALVENDMNFTLIYPDISLKSEYISRYVERGSPEGFIKLISENWNDWITELINQKGCDHIVLQKGEYIADIL